jgi:hypothetical protein
MHMHAGHLHKRISLDSGLEDDESLSIQCVEKSIAFQIQIQINDNYK